MAFLEWSSTYVTGIAQIDADHENLFMFVNVLHENVQKNGPETNIAPVLTVLGEYVKMHFIREEKEMRRANYPGIVGHIEQHRAISRRIQSDIELCNERRGKIDVVELLEFLKGWLSNHVLKSDMDYVPFVNQSEDRPPCPGPDLTLRAQTLSQKADGLD